MLEMLELAARGGEQLLADAHVLVHRAADVEEQQHLDRIVPLGHAASGRAARRCARWRRWCRRDRAHRPRPRARTGAAAQRQLEVARAELDARHRSCGTRAAPRPSPRAAAAGVAGRCECLPGCSRPRRRARCRRVPIHLLPPWCRSCCSASRSRSVSQQLVPAAERLDAALLLLGQPARRQLLQPVRRHLGQQLREGALRALEDAARTRDRSGRSGARPSPGRRARGDRNPGPRPGPRARAAPRAASGTP